VPNIATATMEVRRNRGRPRERWRDEDLNIMGLKQAGNDERPSGREED
jgi:hypothetical protein